MCFAHLKELGSAKIWFWLFTVTAGESAKKEEPLDMAAIINASIPKLDPRVPAPISDLLKMNLKSLFI